MPTATIDLTHQVRLRQIERQLLRLRTTRLLMRCVVLPAFGFITVLLLRHMLAAGADAGLDTLAGGALTLLLATTGFVTASRATRRQLELLEAERARLLQPPSA